MARLVLGTNINNTGTSSIVRDVSPERYRELVKNDNNYLVFKSDTDSSEIIDLSDVTNLDSYVLYKAYLNNTKISGEVDFSSLTKLNYPYSCYQTFKGCTGITSVNMHSLKEINPEDNCTCREMFYGCTNLETIDLSSLEKIDCHYKASACYQMFQGCMKLKSIDLSNLKTINGNDYPAAYMFADCAEIETVNLSKLNAIQGYCACRYMFSNCIKLKNIDLSNLAYINTDGGMEFMFQNCYSLQNINLYSLSRIGYSSSTTVMRNAFQNCTSLINIYFYALNTVSANGNFYNMLSGCSDVTVHFPKNMQSKIGSWTNIQNGFGGTNTNILWDLPSSFVLNGANSKRYERNSKYDTNDVLCWKIAGTNTYDTPYYTSTLNDPEVGATIYSDPECTTAITTINSIA